VRFRYSDLKEAAAHDSVWGLNGVWSVSPAKKIRISRLRLAIEGALEVVECKLEAGSERKLEGGCRRWRWVRHTTPERVETRKWSDI
jgi:hypothetical protein